ncbi:hypothetical protein [Jiangella muralis]|uniref:hypothetical protein n=1 Tax=Jiangella muralis TaxID=702383 RepID=UPI00069FF3D2|nr:hypothetical protein [Jiangella muralis]
MNDREKGVRKLDQVDRRSQVGVSRAMRARDVSRPAPGDIEAALERIGKSPLPPRPSPRADREVAGGSESQQAKGISRPAPAAEEARRPPRNG